MLSFCLIVHSAAVHADISQLLVDQEGNTIRFGQISDLFSNVINGIVAACNLSTNAGQPNASFIETQYWAHLNYNSKNDSYLSVFRLPNSTDDAMMNQTLHCSSTTAQNIITFRPDNTPSLIAYFVSTFAGVVLLTVVGALIGGWCRTGRCCSLGKEGQVVAQLHAQEAQPTTLPQNVGESNSVIISITPSDTASEVALSAMRASSRQSLDQSIK